MEQLIKITSVPMRTVRYTQNARLVSSDSLDLERRKALARQMSFHRNHASGGSALPVEDITRINQTFSRHTVTPKMQNMSQQQVARHSLQFQKQHLIRHPNPLLLPAICLLWTPPLRFRIRQLSPHRNTLHQHHLLQQLVLQWKSPLPIQQSAEPLRCGLPKVILPFFHQWL